MATNSEKNLLSPKELKELSSINPWRPIFRLCTEASVVFALIYIQEYALHSLWTLPLFLVLIASRQHALLILMHESAHRRITNRRFLNDLFGEFIGWHFFVFMHGYRRHHHQHHHLENINTLEDPDWARKQNDQWRFPMKPSRFFLMLFKDLTLLNTYDYFREMQDAKNNRAESATERRWMRARIFYTVCLVLFLIMSGAFSSWLLYWILPIFTTLKVILRVRSITDHFSTSHEHPLSKTRTILTNFVDRLFIGPCAIGSHGVHHLYPSIPYYRLNEAQEKLMRHPTFAKYSHVSRGYWGALRECLAFNDRMAHEA